MNPVWLVRNVRRALAVCPKWSDRFQLIRLIYSSKFPRWSKAKVDQPIAFRFAPPVGDIKAIIRDNDGSDGFIFGEVFEHRYYNFDLPFEPRTILDLGANAGYTAIFFDKRYRGAAIACVEPIPHNVNVLRRNLSLNGIQATVFDAAVAVEDGPIQMEMSAMDYGHKVAVGQAENAETHLTCTGLSVSSLMKQLQWQRIGLLKVDIEGYERVLLKENCSWLRLVDAMCIECHPGYGEADLRQLAEEYGFSEPRQLPGIWLLLSKGKI